MILCYSEILAEWDETHILDWVNGAGEMGEGSPDLL